tara:strand:- start:50 stop:529 length:480 start_codon:yes stop_codon:yes gene_type:complete
MNYSNDFKLSDDFLSLYRSSTKLRHEELERIEKMFDKTEDLLIEEEIIRLKEIFLSQPGLSVQIGDRVWCPSFKCDGTIVDFRITVDVMSDDYYHPSRVPTPDIGVVAVIQPDPSPKLKRERPTFESWKVYRADDPSRTAVELDLSPDRNWNEDWDDFE